MMMAEEMARRRKRVARKVKLTHPTRMQPWSFVRVGAERARDSDRRARRDFSTVCVD